jgi:uncharacterized protein (DUF983 family)
MGQMTSGQHVPSFGSTLWAGIAGRCPSCHRGKLYDGYLTIAPKCDVCGLDYGFADSGDGPAVFVMFLAGFIVVGAALVTEVVYKPPFWVHAVQLKDFFQLHQLFADELSVVDLRVVGEGDEEPEATHQSRARPEASPHECAVPSIGGRRTGLMAKTHTGSFRE